MEFPKRTIQVGKTSYTEVYEFSESNVEKFRQVAGLRSRGRPIKEAIIKMFENQTKKDEIENSEIIEKLIKAIRKMNEELDDLTIKMTGMNQQMVLVRRENYQLKGRIIKLEKGKLDKPFSRKKAWQISLSTTILSLKTEIGGLEVEKMARRAKRVISAC